MNRQLLQFNQTITTDMISRKVVDGAESIVIRSATLPDNVIMNGGMYPAEEIEKSFASLERVLAPVGHPKKDGKFISATDPYAVHNFDVGAYVANVERKNGKVYHDTIINISVANQTERGRALLAAIANMEQTGEPIHTSTGVLLERDENVTPNSGYEWIARNMTFDHNAILLSEEGAATPSQGVGMMVNSELVDLDTFAEETASYTQRLDELKDALKDHVAIRDEPEWCYIADIFDDYFIYEVGFEGSLDEYRKRSYEVDDAGNVTIGETYEVVKAKRIWKANKKLESFMQNMGFANNIDKPYNETVNNQNSEDLEMTSEELKAALAEQATALQANFETSLASAVEPLTQKISALEANANAAARTERETLETNAKAKGFSDEVIAGMQTNALKAVLGMQDKPAADRTAGGELSTNADTSEFSRELP